MNSDSSKKSAKNKRKRNRSGSSTNSGSNNDSEKISQSATKKFTDKQPQQNKIMEKFLAKCDNKPVSKSAKGSDSIDIVVTPKLSPKRRNCARKTITSTKKKIQTNQQEPPSQITKWLLRENQDEKNNKTKDTIKPERSTRQTTKKTKPKSSSSTKFERSASFEKYGLILPSYEDILAHQKRFQDHAKSLESINKLERKVLKEWDNRDFNNLPKNQPRDKKDCKTISQSTLENYFKQFLSTLKAYTNGRRSLIRHEKFLQNKLNPDLCYDDYICFILFTQEQKEILMELLTSEFKKKDDSEDIVSTSYLFKVLLPELCFLIFMEEHSMNKRQAKLYLQNYSLED